jgi:TolB protein
MINLMFRRTIFRLTLICVIVVNTACELKSQTLLKDPTSFWILFTEGNKVFVAHPNLPNRVYDITAKLTGLYFRSVGPISPTYDQLAFVSTETNNREIALLRPDGTTVNLTNNPSADYGPTWSPDGNRVAFLSERDFQAKDTLPNEGGCAKCELYVSNVSSSVTKRITHGGIGTSSANWLNNEEIIYSTSTEGGHLYGGAEQIIKLNLRSGLSTTFANLHKDISSTLGIYYWINSVAPDGLEYVYTSNQNGNNDLFLATTNGTTIQAITYTEGSKSDVSWSPDNNHLVWVNKNLNLSSTVQVLDLETKSIQEISLPSMNAWNPVWAPTGDQIAFVARNYFINGDQTQSIVVVDRNGSNRKFLALSLKPKSLRLIGWISLSWVVNVIPNPNPLSVNSQLAN